MSISSRKHAVDFFPSKTFFLHHFVARRLANMQTLAVLALASSHQFLHAKNKYRLQPAQLNRQPDSIKAYQNETTLPFIIDFTIFGSFALNPSSVVSQFLYET